MTESSSSRTGAWSRAQLSPAEFEDFARFIEEHCGIRMPPAKRIMVESRLRKRLRVLELGSFREYAERVFRRGDDEERTHFLDAITTNKTDFFREPQHFEYLVRTALPELVRAGAGVRRPLAVWSAGCSSGEEPYTLAMVLREVAEGLPGFRFFILGTDLSTKVLNAAARAVYPEDRVEPVPLPLRKKYLLRNRDKGLVRVGPELRGAVRFRRLNLMDADFGLREQMDVVFFRNVMIYFDRPTQEAVLGRICRYLAPGGYFFLGHSESINGLRVPLAPVALTVYRRTGGP